tara:strand:+ start:644 stop:1894 length:1251 start_codon:yes stop_codon:yes gene_type:complete
MARQLQIRNVPESIHNWIDDEREQWKLSKQEFLLGVLERVFQDETQPLLYDRLPLTSEKTPASLAFSFVDIFAGIGGMRFGLEAVGGSCKWSSEWDKHSQKTYAAWHGDVPTGDINEVDPKDIPDHDVLTAGFPCQPFSIAGVSKKQSLGQAHGFECKRQGNLFFKLAEIIEKKRPPVLLLENVKNLRSHDKGRTWQVIRTTLMDLGYDVHAEIVDASGWVPQHRERIFIIGFDSKVFGKDVPFDFANVQPPEGLSPILKEILDPNIEEKYTLTDHLWQYLQQYAAKHKAKGNGFGYGMANLEGITRTLSARYHKDGSEILVPQGRGKNPRRLSPTECARLMGFSGKFARMRGHQSGDLPIVVSNTQAYRQFGNAVSPVVVEAIGHEIVRMMRWQMEKHNGGCLIKRPLRARKVMP